MSAKLIIDIVPIPSIITTGDFPISCLVVAVLILICFFIVCDDIKISHKTPIVNTQNMVFYIILANRLIGNSNTMRIISDSARSGEKPSTCLIASFGVVVIFPSFSV